MYSDLVPAISISTILIIVLSFFGFMRYMNYKETMGLAEKGLVRPEPKPGKRSLRWGIITSALGLAFSLGLYPLGFAEGDEFPLHFGPWMLVGLIPLFIGLSLVLIHYLTEKE